jgi:hypothetical protein
MGITAIDNKGEEICKWKKNKSNKQSETQAAINTTKYPSHVKFFYVAVWAIALRTRRDEK